MTANACKCEVTGCKKDARWAATRLFGKGGTIRTCDDHKPDAAKRPESLRNLSFFYKVEAIDQ